MCWWGVIEISRSSGACWESSDCGDSPSACIGTLIILTIGSLSGKGTLGPESQSLLCRSYPSAYRYHRAKGHLTQSKTTDSAQHLGAISGPAVVSKSESEV